MLTIYIVSSVVTVPLVVVVVARLAVEIHPPAGWKWGRVCVDLVGLKEQAGEDGLDGEVLPIR